MSKMILFLGAFIITCFTQVAFGGAGSFPSGPNVKFLKDNIRFKNTDTKIMTNDADDPTVVAKSAEVGTLYIRQNGIMYQKQDSGSSTNWQTLLIGAPGNGTDECVARWDGTGAPNLNDSLFCITDLGVGSGLIQFNLENLRLDGNTVSSTAGNLVLDPFDGDINLPDETASRPLKLDASNNIISTQIDLASTNDVTGLLPTANGGTNLDTSASSGIPNLAAGVWSISALSAGISGAITDETGTGVLVFNDTPTLLTPTIASFANAGHNHQDAAGGAQLDHGLALLGLGDDDHTQYALLLGRAGGQTLIGGTAAGDDLTLQTTSDGTKGSYIFSELTASQFLKTGAASELVTVANIDLAADVGATILPSANGGTGQDSSAFTGLAKIAAGVWSASTLVDADVSATANITATKLGTGAVDNTELNLLDGLTSILETTLTDANIFIGDGTNVAVGNAVTGDIGITNTGVTSISALAIVDGDVNAAANITATKLGTGAVDNTELNLLDGRTYIPDAVGTDNQVATFNGVNSIDSDANFTNVNGAVGITGDLDVDQINLNGNTISSTGILTLQPSGSNEVQMSLGGIDYQFDDTGTGRLSLQNTDVTNPVMSLELYSNTNDSTEMTTFRVVGSGSPGFTDGDFVDLRYGTGAGDYELISRKVNSGVLKPLTLLTEGNADQVHLATDGKVGIGEGLPSTTLDVAGAISVNGAGVSPNNGFINGGFEDVPDFTIPVGSGTQAAESTVCRIGNCAELVPNGTNGLVDADKCFTNTEWEGSMANINAQIKPSEPGAQACWYDGTSTSLCQTLAEDVWNKFSANQQVNTGDDMCIRISSTALTGTVHVDNLEHGEMKVDGTTKVTKQSIRFDGLAGRGSTNTKIPYFTNERENEAGCLTVENDSTNGFSLTANKDGCHINVNYSQRNNGASFNYFGISRNSSQLTTDIEVINQADRMAIAFDVTNDEGGSVSYSGILNTGDVIRPHDRALAAVATISVLTATSIYYEQKSVLSDATAEATFTDTETCPVNPTLGFTNASIFKCKQKRSGDEIFFDVYVLFSGSPTGSGNIVLPTGLDLDETKLAGDGSSTGYTLKNSNALYHDLSTANNLVGNLAWVESDADNTLRMRFYTDQGTREQMADVSTTAPASWVNGDEMRLQFTVPIVGLTTKPQIVGTFKPAVRSVRYDQTGVQSIGNGTTDIIDFSDVDFDEDSLVTTGAAWKYTAPESGKYLVCAAAGLAASAADYTSYLQLYKNNVGQTLLGTKTFKLVDTGNSEVNNEGCDTIQLVKDDFIDVRYFQNSGGALNTVGAANQMYISIIRIDQAGRLTQETPKKFQTKYLTADVTTDTTISDLTFSNLTIGDCYRVSGRVQFESTVNSFMTVIVVDGAAPIDQVRWVPNGGTQNLNGMAINVLYKATGTSLTFQSSNMDASESINGNNSIGETWAQLSEANCVETNQW